MTSQDLYIAQAYGVYNGKTEDDAKVIFTASSSEGKTNIFQNLSKEGKYSFGGKNYNIYYLGVQTLPGVIIQPGENASNILVGQTGIFELNLSKLTPITTTVSLPDLETHFIGGVSDETNENIKLSCNYCLIDVVYSIRESGETS